MASELPTVAAQLVLAEDDPDDRFLITRALRRCRADLEPHAVRDGVELLDYLRGQIVSGRLPRLVLLDLNMPRMDGREALREIKADPRLCALPVVVLTTSVEPEDLLQVQGLGAASFVSKPEGLSQLAGALGPLLDRWLDEQYRPTELH